MPCAIHLQRSSHQSGAAQEVHTLELADLASVLHIVHLADHIVEVDIDLVVVHTLDLVEAAGTGAEDVLAVVVRIAAAVDDPIVVAVGNLVVAVVDFLVEVGSAVVVDIPVAGKANGLEEAALDYSLAVEDLS